MTLIPNELKIVKIANLFEVALKIPPYQRPYKWSVKSTNTLFIDTYTAFKEGIEEYRLGSVILHKNDARYYIVDGQQRLTTLSILLYCLGEKNQLLLNEKYSTLSNNVIITNFGILTNRVIELSDEEQRKFKQYLFEQCTVVQIVTDSEQEAFQFFDSQNSRGKELAPHDLLKSHHLREMNNEEDYQKVKIINRWENMNQKNLADLFKNYLYPVTQWYKGKDGLGYSSNKIDAFKGVKNSNTSNYAIYHKASNLFIEQFNLSGSNQLIATQPINQFQLTQSLIAGKRFFNYTLHYNNLLEKIQIQIKQFHDANEIPAKRSGDIYIKQLYECSLLFFVDRFGFEYLTRPVMQHLYSWSYSLRLAMQAVYPLTINKYSLGIHERANEGLDMFFSISEMVDPDDIKLIVLQQPEINENNKKKYEEIYNKICKWNGWVNNG